jgi:ribose transport system substrate-binding protein
MKMARLLICLLALLASSTISNCATEKKPPELVLYVTLTLGNPFYEEMIAGLKEGLLSQPTWQLDARAGTTPDDASSQRDIMESILTSHLQRRLTLKGLVLVPANSRFELTSTIRRYNQAGIPVINVDIPIDPPVLEQSGAHIASFIGSNNKAGGASAADEMAKRLPAGGNLLLLLGPSGSANTRDRAAGFRERLQTISTSKNVRYDIREWTANWKMSEALTATDTILGSGSRLDGIFAENDLMALGAAQAIATQPLTGHRPIVIGYDAIPDAVKAVRVEGRLAATISQNPSEMGKKAIEYLGRIDKHQDVPARTIIPVSPITK